MSIEITPTVQPEGKLALAFSVEFKEGLDTQSAKGTTTIDPERTLILGGMITRETKTETLRFPWLGQHPTVGQWFRYPVTRTVVNCRYFLVSTAIVPEAAAQKGAE